VFDGSTDETTAVLDRYKDEIKVIELSSNRGVSVARNAGISVASGEWISFLDSDDEWVLDKCESQWNFLKQAPFLRWIQSNETWIRQGQVVNQKKYHAKHAGFIFDFCLDRCMVSPSSVMIHRAVFACLGVFDPDFLACEDYELWLRFSRNLLIGLDESVSLRKYAGHEGQLSNQVCLDRYRVQALERVLGSGKARPFLDRVTDVLEKKKDILVQGALKRG
jgi:glycosyltransferase involved in cell wall biosynthesis